MKYRIALVEYLNTLPFYEGMRVTGLDQELDIHRVVPAECARMFKQDEVDISLCPVGALDEMPEHKIVGDYCIGADGPVGTVMLLSTVPMHHIKTVRLDSNSRTSNLLVKVLAQRYWQTEWTFYEKENGVIPDAVVMIGDNVFKEKANYPFQYDLAGAWKELTGLPMVFAVWIAKSEVPDEIIKKIDDSFRTGMEYVLKQDNSLQPWQVEYLQHSISYPLDDNKKQALAMFRAWKENFHPSFTP
jgi:chorismate dehydratase